MTSLHEVALLRLVAHQLVRPDDETPTDVVRRLTAVQAQDLPGALTSVALRTTQRSRAQVAAALDAGEVVRTWPMRGTLHLVAAEDASWMVRLLAPRVVRSAAARLRELELTEAHVERAGEVARAALTGGRRLRRADLFARWEEAGLVAGGQRGVHLLRLLAMDGTLVLGPLDDGEQVLVLLDEWVAAPRDLVGEEALAELALRYFRSHGPATLADLARWAQVKVTDARAATAAVRDRLATLDVDGTEHLMDPLTPDRLATCRREASGVLLLPGFDELLLGYADRSAVLDPRHADRILPGGNGVFRPTVVSDGRVVGTWSRAGGRRQDVEATPFTRFDETVSAAIPALHASLP
jgi:hypothetical protein